MPIQLPAPHTPLVGKNGEINREWYRALLNTTQTVNASPSLGSQLSGLNPTGTTAGSPVMMGLGGSIKCAVIGRALVIAGGQAQSTVNDGGGSVQLAFGTGNAPANGAAQTGTLVGASIPFITVPASTQTGIILVSLLTNLTLRTEYWLDVALSAVGSGTASLTNFFLQAIEL